MTEISLSISSHFAPLLYVRPRYLVLCGGRGSGKSEFAARKKFYRCITEGGHRFLIMRKVRATCKESVVAVFQSIMAENGLPCDYNKTDRIINIPAPNGFRNELLFNGMDDPEKIKSIKGITGVWIEEATEFSKDDFMAIDMILREVGPEYLQIILSFNPDETQAPWLKEMFFQMDVPPYTTRDDAIVDVSTIEHNPIASIRSAYMERLDLIDDEALRKMWRFGIWAAIKGRIYTWDTQPLPADKVWDEVWYGLDFGFSVDPAACVRIYRKADEYWLEEVLYQTGLTNADLAAALKAKGIGESLVVCDSAEQKSVEELRRSGICAVGAEKGPESVKAGIDFIKSKTVHVTPNSANLIAESRTYKWKEDGNGNPLPMPVKYKDHGLDAARYGITYGQFGVRPAIWSM